MHRRELLRSIGAVGAITWAAPAVATVRLGQTPGSEAPGTTTTAAPTGHEFSGPIATDWTGTPGDNNPCFGFAHFDFPVTLSGLGPAMVVIDACLGLGVNRLNVLSGTFTLTTANGALSGPVTGGEFSPLVTPGPTFVFIGVSISAGTGAFAGATGDAGLSGQGDNQAHPLTGTFDGTYFLP